MKFNRFCYIVFSIVVMLSSVECRRAKTEEASPVQSPQQTVIVLTRQSIKDIGLTLAAAEYKALTKTLVLPAELKPNQDLEAQVGSSVQGRVHQVFVKLGDEVKKGQDLAFIEGLEIGEIKAQFITAKSRHNLAKAVFERQKVLLEQNVGSQKALLEAEAEYQQARADLNAQDKKIHSVGLTDEEAANLGNEDEGGGHNQDGGILSIKAPIAGKIVERNIVMGQLVDVSTTLFKIINTSTLWADGQLDEKDLPLIKNLHEAALTVSALPDQPFLGKIIYIGENINEQTRTIQVRLQVPNSDHRLKAGMFAEMHIPVTGGSPCVVIPEQSVISDPAGAYVFKAADDSTFAKQAVVVGAAGGGSVEIIKGVVAGERVVVEGSFLLKSELMKDLLEGGE